MNQTAATSRAVKEKFRKTCNLCSDLNKPLICNNRSVYHTFQYELENSFHAIQIYGTAESNTV